MKFLKGRRNEFESLKEGITWGETANIVQRQMAEVFDSKNLSFLIGSGCSSLLDSGKELGIPTMKPLAEEFQARLMFGSADGDEQDFVSQEQKERLRQKLGINLSSDDVKNNLEQMMVVLINAHQFCKTSENEEMSAVVALVDEVIVGIKKFVLHKCTTGSFANGDDRVVTVYRRFYQSLITRSRGLTPPWVFTTNYDLFNERAMDRSGIPYSNGFSGTIERRFNPSTYRLALAEQLDITSRRWAAVDGFVHFCKLHGSVNWVEESEGLYPIRESHDISDPSADRVMIYPTPSKQTASFGSPYADMFREFQRQVVQDQSVLLTMGYSFSDEHVNNIIFQGLSLPGFRLIAFLDPETNDITRELAALGDPRIWFIWGDGQEEDKKAHYFDAIVDHLLPVSSDQKVDNAIEKALQTLLGKQQEAQNGEE